MLKPKSVSSAVFKAKRPHADVMEEIISHMEGCMPKEVTKKEEISENQVMSKERHRAKEAFFMKGINISHLDNVVNSMELMNLVYAVELGEKVYMGRSCEILYSKKRNRNTKNAILL